MLTPMLEIRMSPDCCGGNRYFEGIIDEVMIFDRALSDEILQLATQGLAVEPLNKLTTTWGKMNRMSPRIR